MNFAEHLMALRKPGTVHAWAPSGAGALEATAI